jgi:5S rRNA maturation endonuclease (ribonuclease M5)
LTRDPLHGNIRGPSNAEQRWHKAAQALAEVRQRNREAGVGILVEGRRDRRALERLGFSGPVELLHRGWPVDDVVLKLVERYGRVNAMDSGPSLVLLMDWDRTGGRLQTLCRRNLESLDVRFDESLRATLMVCLKPETRVVEGLSGLVDVLVPLIDLYDDLTLRLEVEEKEKRLP